MTSIFYTLSDLRIRMSVMTIGKHSPLFHSSDDFTLLTSPTMLGDSQKGSWHENTVLVDSWKIIAFPIRVGFGNCFVVRLTCMVLVLFCSITWVSTHMPRGSSIPIQIYMGWCTHPACTHLHVFTSPSHSPHGLQTS